MYKNKNDKNDPQKKFIDEALKAHNYYRKMHGVPSLTHNPELSKIALKYAQEIASKKQMVHSNNKYNGESLGENLAMWFETDAEYYHGKQASKQWYDEIQYYKYSKPGFNVKTGHFTQLVWRDSREVGFGVAIALNGYFYAVAYYYPAGNIDKQYAENVLHVVLDKQPSLKDNETIKQKDDDEDNGTGCC